MNLLLLSFKAIKPRYSYAFHSSSMKVVLGFCFLYNTVCYQRCFSNNNSRAKNSEIHCVISELVRILESIPSPFLDPEVARIVTS